MKTIIQIEEATQLILAYLISIEAGYQWWVFFAWLLLPDISMLGYIINTKAGAFLYNIFHHKGIAIFIAVIGYYLGNKEMQFAGLILFGHSSMDRALGYGLKYADNFKHTHLGWIGINKQQ